MMTEQERDARREEGFAVSSDIVTKLVSLEVTLAQGFRRLDEKMDRFQSDIHENQIDSNNKINHLENNVTQKFAALDKEMTDKFTAKRARMDAMDLRVTGAETWQKVAMAKVTALMAATSIMLTLFAPSLRHILGVPN